MGNLQRITKKTMCACAVSRLGSRTPLAGKLASYLGRGERRGVSPPWRSASGRLHSRLASVSNEAQLLAIQAEAPLLKGEKTGSFLANQQSDFILPRLLLTLAFAIFTIHLSWPHFCKKWRWRHRPTAPAHPNGRNGAAMRAMDCLRPHKTLAPGLRGCS